VAATLDMSVARLAVFALTACVVIAIPGPSVLFVVSRALAHGRRVAILSVLGNTAGEYVQVIAVALGLGTIAERSVTAYAAIKIVGGLYLIYLGVRTWRGRASLHDPAASGPAGTAGPSVVRSFRQGFVVGVTNPKTMVFLAAILPQFATAPPPGVPGQILVLGAVFSLIAILSDSAWAILADRLRLWFARSPRHLDTLGGASGAAITAIGIGVLASGRHA